MAKLTRAAWIQAGLEMLDLAGHGAVSAERVARRLDVTRGSFYHHFAHKAAFVDALLERWEHEYTAAVIREAARASDAAGRLQRYVAVASQLRPEREVAIRAWAARDERVRAVLARVDRTRTAFARELGRELLPVSGEAQVEAFARVAYLGFIGLQQTGPHDSARFAGFFADLLMLAAARPVVGAGG